MLYVKNTRVDAILPRVVAPAFTRGRFIGFFINEEPVLISCGNGSVFAYDTSLKPYHHPHVGVDGSICLGALSAEAEGGRDKMLRAARAALQTVNLDSAFFRPVLSVSPDSLPDSLPEGG